MALTRSLFRTLVSVFGLVSSAILRFAAAFGAFIAKLMQDEDFTHLTVAFWRSCTFLWGATKKKLLSANTFHQNHCCAGTAGSMLLRLKERRTMKFASVYHVHDYLSSPLSSRPCYPLKKDAFDVALMQHYDTKQTDRKSARDMHDYSKRLACSGSLGLVLALYTCLRRLTTCDWRARCDRAIVATVIRSEPRRT